MRQIRATASVDPEDAPAFFNLLAHSPEVTEARVIEVNTTLEGLETFLIAIEGDPTAFAAEATETPGVESVEVAQSADGSAYAMMEMRPLETPLFETIHRTGWHIGLVLMAPIIYRDGTMSGRVVGDAEALQRAFESAPEAIDVEIEEIGAFPTPAEDPASALSDRQREALGVALELGYYDQPRAATHEDIAAELGCAPATASDHLQKAEAKCVRAVADEFSQIV